MAGTVVQDTVEKFQARLEELRPALDEAQEIEQALEALNAGKPRTARNGSGTRKRTRRSADGEKSRAEQFLAIVKENPGITVSDAGKKMAVNPNYLYRVSSDLVKDGSITKDGKGYFPTEGEKTASEGDDK